LGVGRSGHAGKFLVLAEVVLKGDGRERLVLALDLHLFFCFDRLMETIAPTASRHQTPGELVDDDDLAVLHHVVDVELEDRVRAPSMRMLSTSSTIAKLCPRWTYCDRSNFMLSRR